MKFLVFANGEPNDGVMVRRALTAAAGAVVVAADGGARVAGYFGLGVDQVIGDMDSLAEGELKRLQAAGAAVERHPPEKDATDLELALKWAAGQGAEWVRIVGGIGGRFDQVLANVYLMALPELRGCDIEIVAGRQAIRLLQSGEHQLRGRPGDTVSLIPIGGDVHGVTTRGLKYPLADETLHFGPARGISNVMQADSAYIGLREGLLLLVHTVGRA